MKANCYLLSDSLGNTALIDPGDDAEYIISTIQRNDLVPQLIIATHGHVDHVMAILELKLAFNIPFYMNIKDLFLLKNMRTSAKHYLGIDPGPSPEIDFNLKEKLEFGELKLKIIETPGHTPGSVSLYLEDHKKIFVGDLIFEDGLVGRTDFSYSSEKELKKSVQRVKELGEIEILPGHGEIFFIV